uniref:Mating factor a1.3 n=1 Tax=Ustanciosporium gigantosporum TaxID=1134041 RepID=H2CZ24_9BASI|nr:mating factor a1.3 [Ustanciosporium gigantosporum]
MDKVILFAPISVGAVSTEQAPVDQEKNPQSLPWTGGCVIA